MHLNKLRLFNFRNYEEADLTFETNLQCFVGRNGGGKTNLLDAICYLAFTKSAREPSDARNIRQGETQFLISGQFTRGSSLHDVTCGYQQGAKKVIAEDGQVYDRFSKHVGKYPSVLIAPDDSGLISEGSELRRKFIDSLLSQTDHNYLEQLIIYTQILKQRNGSLRIFAERGVVDQDLLDAYDEKLVPAGEYIAKRRRGLMHTFLPLLSKYYEFLAGSSTEPATMIYRTTLEESDFREALKQNLERDILLQRTSVGVHRDDFLFTLYGGELRRLGSQGQQKSFLIALKLSEFQIITQEKGMKPLLLLDDIFDKLDDERIQKLMLLVADGTFGQLLITDARSSRAKQILDETGVVAELFGVEKGIVSRI